MTIIYVVTTGGMIEKAYSEQTGEVRNLDSKIDRYLGLLRLPVTRRHARTVASFVARCHARQPKTIPMCPCPIPSLRYRNGRTFSPFPN
jgi:hypothetical protein